MLFWLENPEDAAACAERATRKVRIEHSMEAYASAIARVYEELVPQQMVQTS